MSEKERKTIFAIISLVTIHPKSFQINLLGLVDDDDDGGNDDDDHDDKNENEFTLQIYKLAHTHTYIRTFDIKLYER
jgi:hypothetical protein